MNKTKTYYQPVAYMDDGTNIDYGNIPNELHSFQAFANHEDCEEWLENNGYDPGDYAIIEYHDEDIEGVTIIDGDGDVLETNEGEHDEETTVEDYKDTPTCDLFQIVHENCSKETILDMAEQFIGEDEIRNFLFACMGLTIE